MPQFSRERPRVSVVIPTWNGASLLVPALESLARQTFRDFETIVVDNGSTDGTAGILVRNFPWVTRVGFASNRGFSVAVNEGIRASRGELVALLNNDIELDPEWLQTAVSAMDRYPDAGSIASRIYDYWNREQIYSAGDLVQGIPVARGFGQPDGPEFDEPVKVASPCAAAALYRMAMLREIGLLNESYFAYFEDVELGLRGQIAGYSCVYIPGAVAYHMGSVTAARISRRTAFYRLRNLVQLSLTTLPPRYLLRSLPRLVRAVSASIVGEAGPVVGLLAMAALVGRAPRMAARRREIMRGRRVTNAELERILEPPTPVGVAIRRALRESSVAPEKRLEREAVR
jgi:GT2 family glycosyltransferase